jgi:hypothetical protein
MLNLDRAVLRTLAIWAALSLMACASGGGGGGDGNGTGSGGDDDGGNGGGGGAPEYHAIEVTPSGEIAQIGETVQFAATAIDENGDATDVTDSVDWSSSDAAVAAIDASGLATGVAGGLVTITATEPESGLSGAAGLGVEFASEGSVEAPVELVLEELQVEHAGQAGTGLSYYVVNAGGNYGFALDGLSDDLDLHVFDNTGFTGTAVCRPFMGRTAPESCFCDAYAGPVEIAIDGTYSILGSSFDLQIWALPGCEAFAITPPPANEGSVESPVLVGVNEGASAQVDNGTSYYRAEVQAGVRYVVSITGSGDSENLRLGVYDGDASFENSSCVSELSGTSQECVVTPSSANVYLSVDNLGYVDGETLDLAVLSADGSAATPVELYPEKTSPGWVNDQTSYYAFRSVPDTTYQVQLTTDIAGSPSATPLLSVFNSDSSFATAVCQAAPSGRGAAVCTVTATGSRIYASVSDNGTGRGALYWLAAPLPQ